jgi:hypothetical protein
MAIDFACRPVCSSGLQRLAQLVYCLPGQLLSGLAFSCEAREMGKSPKALLPGSGGRAPNARVREAARATVSPSCGASWCWIRLRSSRAGAVHVVGRKNGAAGWEKVNERGECEESRHAQEERKGGADVVTTMRRYSDDSLSALKCR